MYGTELIMVSSRGGPIYLMKLKNQQTLPKEMIRKCILSESRQKFSQIQASGQP